MMADVVVGGGGTIVHHHTRTPRSPCPFVWFRVYCLFSLLDITQQAIQQQILNQTPGKVARLKIKKKKKVEKKLKKKQKKKKTKKKTYRRLELAQAFFTVEYKHLRRSIRRSDIMPKTDLMITSISSLISFGNMVGVKVVVAILKKKRKNLK